MTVGATQTKGFGTYREPVYKSRRNIFGIYRPALYTSRKLFSGLIDGLSIRPEYIFGTYREKSGRIETKISNDRLEIRTNPVIEYIRLVG